MTYPRGKWLLLLCLLVVALMLIACAGEILIEAPVPEAMLQVLWAV